MKARIAVLWALLLVLFPLHSHFAWAQAGKPHIPVSYSSVAGTETALWVAEDTGLFDKYGLDVSIKRLPGSSLVAQAMVGGDVHIAQIGGTAVVDSRLAGVDMVYLASVIDTMVASIYSLPSITKLQDLKGKRIGVTRAGSITDFFGRYALQTVGLVPGKDVGIVQTGGIGTTLSSLKIHAIQAGVVVAPLTLMARRLGFHELVDMTKIGGPFPFNGVVTTREYIRKSRGILRRFMKGYVAGISVALKEPARTMKIIGKYSRLTDPAMLKETYRVNVAKAFRKVPYPSVAGFKTILNFVAQTQNPKAKDIDPRSIVDPSFVKELDKSGFIKRLYQ